MRSCFWEDTTNKFHAINGPPMGQTKAACGIVYGSLQAEVSSAQVGDLPYKSISILRTCDGDTRAYTLLFPFFPLFPFLSRLRKRKKSGYRSSVFVERACQFNSPGALLSLFDETRLKSEN